MRPTCKKFISQIMDIVPWFVFFPIARHSMKKMRKFYYFYFHIYLESLELANISNTSWNIFTSEENSFHIVKISSRGTRLPS
jgi:hypothetical protein